MWTLLRQQFDLLSFTLPGLSFDDNNNNDDGNTGSVAWLSEGWPRNVNLSANNLLIGNEIFPEWGKNYTLK